MKDLIVDGRGRIRLLVLAVLAAALALTGAAKVGHAGTSTNGQLTASISVLNDQSPLVLGAPTPGGNIGYDLRVFNDPTISTNTVNHVAFSDSIGSKGTVVYINAPSTVSCSGMGTSTLSCTSAQLASGAGFDVIVLFSTDPNATAGVDTITNSGSGTYAPQSNNTSNNRTDPTKTFAFGPIDRTYGGGSGLSVDQSLTLPGDPLNTAAGFFVSNVKMPPGFLNSNNYVGVTLRNDSGVLPPSAAVACPTCQPFEVSTTIPLATTVTSPNNPFLQGGSTQAYAWSFTIQVPNGFKPTGVFHTDDSNANGAFLPNCSIVNGQPVPLTTAPGICVSGMDVNKRTNPNQVTYSGIGVANGNAWGA
jgi:hypothetical protein